MRKRLLPILAIAAAALLLALPLLAARPLDDALLFVPADSASVGMVRLADLRTSPLSSRLFEECDHFTVDGDAARFLEDAKLDAKHDVDVVVVAGSPKGGSASGLVVFEGRFDPDRLASALATRGAVKKGDYFLLPEHRNHGEKNGDAALALVGRHFVVAGTEDAVERALAQKAAGGAGFGSGHGLGRELSRIETGATAWVLVDTARFPELREKASHVHIDGDVNGHPIPAILGAMKSISLLSFQATAKGDALKLEASGVTADAETRDLLEDTLKGALAAFRLVMQDKPDAVAMLRRFKVTNGRDAVTISGTLPGAAVRAIVEKRAAVKTASTN
ncbi:MAG TPA: hypothetical protein VKF32_02975 [Thermoanaerobaculia bacterium]|nr:hypothetical protein [Thermoanaerobaculia bacterium]